MKILSIRTDQPEAYLGLWNGRQMLTEKTWPAHRELSNTIHHQIEAILAKSDLSLSDIDGLLVFKGPGSFTGLRISAAVFNSLAFALSCPIVGTSGDNWQEQGIDLLISGKNEQVVVPDYGADANISSPKK
jgi:tRNA threonylcarbamoyl adenosine modification protein YeaZ